jgi:predicted secreted protein
MVFELEGESRMRNGPILVKVMFVFVLSVFSWTGCAQEASSPAGPTESPQPPEKTTGEGSLEPIVLDGPSCPENFEDRDTVREGVTLSLNERVEIHLGSNPSMPCGWGEIDNPSPGVVRMVEQTSQWPAEGATEQPGAPGTEIWIFEAQQVGESLVTWPCTCLGEEGAEQQREGEFMLQVQVGE